MATIGAKAGHSPSETAFPIDSPTWTKVVESLRLAPQQARIVRLLLLGMHDKEIAAELSLGIPTVRTYLNRVFQRIGVKDRVELILRVFQTAQEIRDGHQQL